MSNTSVLLVAFLLALIQQQLLQAAGYSSSYAGNKEGSRHAQTHATHQHQHRHQHFVSGSKANELYQQQQQRQHHHHQGQHQQQHGLKNHQQLTTQWLRSDKLQQQDKFNAITTEPTETIKAVQQKQYMQQQQHAASHTSSKGQRQTATSTVAASLSEVSAANTATTTASSVPSNHKSPSSSLAAARTTLSSPLSRALKSHVPADAIQRTGHSADYDRLRGKSAESLDYADDYYYDDVEDAAEDGDVNAVATSYVDDDDVYVENNDDADELDAAAHANELTARGAARVVRAHQTYTTARRVSSTDRLEQQSRMLQSGHHQYRDWRQQLLSASDQDYADDEPYRSSAEHNQNDTPETLTEQKFRELGTLKAAQQTRDKILSDEGQTRPKTPAELAREHMDRMKIAGRCNRPLPRVIHVSNETSKRYVPYCTILHRCGEDTGCCDSTRQVCAAKSFEDVPVYFFVIKVNSRSNKRDTEVLMMRNHTECHCVNRSNLTPSLHYMPRDKRSDLSRRRYQHHQQQLQQHQSLLQYHQHQSSSEQQDEASNTICRCPKHFDVFPENAAPHAALNYGGALRCRCDCLSHNLPCRRLQDGEEGFAVDERKCIAERNCKTPVCLHGDYSHQTGRCPRRENHKRTVTRYDYGYG